MTSSRSGAAPSPVERTTTPEGQVVLRFGRDLTSAQVAQVWPSLPELLRQAPAIRLDLSAVEQFDSSGLALLLEVRRRVSQTSVERAPDSLKELLPFVTEEEKDKPKRPRRERPSLNPLVGIGGAVLRFADDTLEMLRFIGESTLALGQVLLRPRRLRYNDVFYYMARSGPDAIGIVALISFMIGLTLAFESAHILPRYGAEEFTANIVAYSIVRELGPMMTAIVMAGRSGAAFAAEIGTMKVNEEVDALITMGFPTNRFLVLPKLIALSVMMPCLVLLADVVGVGAGFLVAISLLEFSFGEYWNQTISAIVMGDVLHGLLKSFIFGVLVAGIGCRRGFETPQTSAKGVGEATTSAVVSAIFLIILVDALFSVTSYFAKT